MSHVACTVTPAATPLALDAGASRLSVTGVPSCRVGTHSRVSDWLHGWTIRGVVN